MRTIVIGGGIVGASTAYHLTRRGVSTTLVDRCDDGQATAAGAGIVAPWTGYGPGDPWRPLALGAARHYPWLLRELAAEGAGDTGYARVGGISLATDPGVPPAVVQWADSVRGDSDPAGVGEIQRLAAGEPALRFPVLRPDFAGVWVSGSARVDGRLLRAALLRAAEARGLERLQGTAELVAERGRVAEVRVAGRRLTADGVVLAAGAWTDELLSPWGYHLGIEPQRGQILHLCLPEHQVGDWPTIRAESGEYYLLTFPDHRVVVGATRESGTGFSHRVTAGGLRYVIDTALEIAPGLSEATVVETRVGFRPMSADGLPLLGPVEGLAGVVVATGLGSVGLTYGPYVGRVAADLVSGDETGTELAPYAPLR